MEVYVVDKIDVWGGQHNVEYKVFDSLEKARQCMKIWKDDDYQFIDDVTELIKDGNNDCTLIEDEDYFYCYDGLNFDSKEITIEKREVL